MKIQGLNLSSLKYFLDAVQFESLTRSAEINFVTRPAISQAIRRLEDWSGQTLLTHEKNVFKLTQSGQTFYRKMRPLFEQLKGSIESQSVEGGPLRIGCSASLMEPFLLPHLKTLKNLKSLHLSAGRSEELLQRLENDEIAIAIVIGDREQMRNSKVLWKGEYILCSRSGELGGAIVTTETRNEVVELQTVIAKKRIENVAYLRVDSWSVGAKVAASMNSACLLPDFMLGQLKKVKSIPFRYPYQVTLVHRNLEHLSENEVRLIEIITRSAR